MMRWAMGKFRNIGCVLLSLSLFLLIATLLLCSPETGLAQGSVVTGSVYSANTGLPIPDVNVFLSSTNLGSATDGEGNYRIRNIPNGVYQLVFSYIGYTTRVRELNLITTDTLTIDINLKPEPVQLGELSVTGERDREWENNLNIFRREFIGATSNAEKTEIRNPEILAFEWNASGTVLSADADKELQIVNRALGYEINVVLNKFEYIARDQSRGLEDVVDYLIYPRFSELAVSDSSRENQWAENRSETYLGSFRHFLFSLYHDRLREERFTLLTGSIERLDSSTEDYLLRYRPMNREYRRSLKGYRLRNVSTRNPLTIEFKKSQKSYLMKSDDNVFFVNEYGKLLDVRSLIIGGAWHRRRLAEELPLNYVLQEERVE